MLRRNRLFIKLKPYSLMFDTADVPKSDLGSHKVPGFLIEAIRAHGGKHNLDEIGIAVEKLNRKISHKVSFD